MEAIGKKLLNNLQNDLRTISNEAKKKHPSLKEAAESGIVRIRSAASRHPDLRLALLAESAEILEPFFMACDTKVPKLVQTALVGIQRLITFEAVSTAAALNVVNNLWSLMEAGSEEVKLLQTITLLITTNNIAQSDALARALALCFRLNFTKNSTINNTASATIRQLVFAVFERVQAEDKTEADKRNESQLNLEELKNGSKTAPKSLRPAAADAFLLFQDLVQLVNADQPLWLCGLIEMTRTFGLELLESILTSFPETFFNHQEFSFLLKEKVCPLVIKLFSPNIKFKQQQNIDVSNGTENTSDKPFYPISIRLLRIVNALIQKYFNLLLTECEIFLALLVKFLDADKPQWQNIVALEVLSKMATQPSLLRSLCNGYDMKPKSSRIFRDIVNSIGLFGQSVFLSALNQSITNMNSPPPTFGNTNGSSSVNGSNQTMFAMKGVWIPLIFSLQPGQAKIHYLEQLEKFDAPTIPDGYGLTLSFHSTMEITRSILTIVESSCNSASLEEDQELLKGLDDEIRSTNEGLLYHSWCGLLSSLALFLYSSTDETITENLLGMLHKLTYFYGLYNITEARDSALTIICKASLPFGYVIPTVSVKIPSDGKWSESTSTDFSSSIQLQSRLSSSVVLLQQHQQLQQHDSSSLMSSINGQSVQESSDFRQQVVAVGTALGTSPNGAVQQGPVMLTAKNLQCMKCLLAMLSNSSRHSCGDILTDSWYIALNTLQHLIWILGLNPTNDGGTKVKPKSEAGGANMNSLITTAAMSDLPVLSAMLSRLFESSQDLKTDSLMNLVQALIKLSNESIQMALNNREPSLFAISKLLETGIVNMNRLDIIWDPISGHLLLVCESQNVKIREWGVGALTSLIRNALQAPDVSSKCERKSILEPLTELSSISFTDIRQKQLECTLQVIQASGDSLGACWAQIINILGALNETQNESLIRLAFQSQQLVVNDFIISTIPDCLQAVADTTAKFGTQTRELNVSLTAIGLLWNIADILFQNREKIEADMDQASYERLWVSLFTHLANLCTDSRASIRKSACQTLFSALSTHGTIFNADLWQSLLWQVLFPLLDRVRHLSESASCNKIVDVGKSIGVSENSGNILLHHSRNTAQKQWSETQVLALTGVAQIFNLKQEVMFKRRDTFIKAWTLVLEHIRVCCLSKNVEVSISALKCFQELICSAMPDEDGDDRQADVWQIVWNVWTRIGLDCMNSEGESKESSQLFLTSLIQLFPYIFTHLKHVFNEDDFHNLSLILENALTSPIDLSVSHTPFVLTSSYQDAASGGGSISMSSPNGLNSLQEAALFVLETLQKDILSIVDESPPDAPMIRLLPKLYQQLLTFVAYSWETTNNRKQSVKMNASDPSCVQAFSERCLRMLLAIYQKTASHPVVIKNHCLHLIIKAFRVPLTMKYSCPSQSSWKLVINALICVLQVGLNVARTHDAEFIGIYADLAACLESFLFSNSKPPSSMSLEEQQADEVIDVKVVQVIRESILPFAGQMPKEFVLQIISLLNRGSIHSAAKNSSPVDTETSRKLRQEFARACFETLLQFSFLGPRGNPNLFIQSPSNCDELGSPESSCNQIGLVNKLAVASLLSRFREVVVRFVEDEKLSGKCPLPRHRMAEISFVLQALATLASSLKKVPTETVESGVWDQLISLYPHLVDCTLSNCSQVNRSLREVLLEYKDLLAPPSSS